MSRLRLLPVLGIVISLVMVSPALAQAQASLSLYELERGVRPVGMGGAFVGLADDESALYYNPAGLSFLGYLRTQSLFEPRFGRATYGSFLIAGRNLGLGVVFVTLPGLSQRDSSGRELDTFNYTSYGATLAWGSAFADLPWLGGLDILRNLGLGLSAKLYGVKTLAAGSGTSFSLDTGWLYRWPLGAGLLNELRLGLVFENLGPAIAYQGGHTESWGSGARLGVGAKMLDGAMNLALDAEFNGTLHLGGEYRLGELSVSGVEIDRLALRLGLMGGPGLFAFNAGLGLQLIHSLHVDYALSLSSEWPSSHRLGAAYSFDMQSLLCPIFRGSCVVIDERTQTPSFEPGDPDAKKDPPHQ